MPITKLCFAIFILFIVSSTARKAVDLQIYPDVQPPTVESQYIPQQLVSKMLYENYVSLVEDINFQVSSYLYMRNGALQQDQVYNISNYGGFESKCRIYKTDLKTNQYTEVNLPSNPIDYIVIENQQITDNGEVATIYTVLDSDQVFVASVFIQNSHRKPNQEVNLTEEVLTLKEKQNLTIGIQKDEHVKVFQIDDQPYFATNTKLIWYNPKENKKVEIKGFSPKEHILRAQQMISYAYQNLKPTFYILTPSKIYVYRFISDDQVQLIDNITDFGSSSLLTAEYQDGYFFVTARDKLFVIDDTLEGDYNIFVAKVNGTCSQIEIFQSTLHLSCQYDRLYYISEFLFASGELSLNRYYASEDIQGRAVARRLGYGKMAIVTDSDIRMMGYGLNREVLLDLDNPQPDFTFLIKFGLDIKTLPSSSNELITSAIILTQDRIIYSRIVQTPPEINCNFNDDKVGAQYQLLLLFNTSRCSYIEFEEDLLLGSIETICEVSIPYLITTRQVQLEQSQSIFIQVFFILLLLAIFLSLIACFMRCNKNMEDKFNKVKEALEKAKRGYNKDKKADI